MGAAVNKGNGSRSGEISTGCSIAPVKGKVLPVPVCCDVCRSARITYTANDIVYGELKGEWPYCYYCLDCKALVHCHKGTATPFGRMANEATRALRRSAHFYFDRIWKHKVAKREEAYYLLAERLGIKEEDSHISWLTHKQLNVAASWAKDYYNERIDVVNRRKDKKHERLVRRREREIRAINARKSKR